MSGAMCLSWRSTGQALPLRHDLGSRQATKDVCVAASDEGVHTRGSYKQIFLHTIGRKLCYEKQTKKKKKANGAETEARKLGAKAVRVH